MQSRVLDRVLPAERLLFASDLVCAGTFDCAIGDPSFAGGEPSTSHCIVFSRTPVWIQHDGGARYVADATRITLHNRGGAYRRWKIDDRGDRCNWLAYAGDVAWSVIRRVDPARSDSSCRAPFAFQFAMATAAMYLRQRQLFAGLAGGDADSLPVEEEALALLHAVAARMYADNARPARETAGDRARAFAAVHQVRAHIAAAPARPHRLRPLASVVGLSPYQLCRAFARVGGETLTAYRSRLRVLGALDAVCGGEDLTRVAIESGFASHSHFTWAFRRTFGVPPSAVRGTRITTLRSYEDPRERRTRGARGVRRA